MNGEALYLWLLLGAALIALYKEWLRIDLVALLILVALLVPWRRLGDEWVGVLSLSQALSGFGSPAVAMIASMFVLSAALQRTGAASWIGEGLLRLGSRSELMLQATLLTVVTLFSALVSDTATVLVWMPLVLAVAKRRRYAPSRLLLPLAFASLLGGQWTLIGTRSNILASDFLHAQTGTGLGFLDFTPVAACIWAVSLAYFLLIGRRFLPHGGPGPSLTERYEVKEFLTEVMASPSSSMLGKTLRELNLDRSFDVTLLGVVRAGESLEPDPALLLRQDDVLIVQGQAQGLASLLEQPGLQVKEELKLRDRTLRRMDLRLVEALVVPRSRLEGQSLLDSDFRRRYDLSVLAVGHQGRSISERPLDRELAAGDSLLFVCHERVLEELREEPDVALLESRPLPLSGKRHGALLLGLLLFIVVASALRLLHPAFCMLVSALVAVLSGCLGVREAYRAIDWRIVMVLGGMIPLGLALETSGAAHDLAQAITFSAPNAQPWVVFGLLLLVTVALTQVIENAAVAVILAPIAYELAVASGSSPVPFLLGMAICTSAGFSTPWAHESTLLVFAPGRYKARDYFVQGFPFTVITWLVTLLVVPRFFPLTP
ncbi:MAG: SLC13 family permease [Planctomycetes bacterium]|nr:SLC13 family permease [Planctomycetota bacterium]